MHQTTKHIDCVEETDFFLFLLTCRFSAFPHRVPFNTCHFPLMFS